LHDLAGDRVTLTLAAPEPDFTYKPLTVQEPFSLSPAEQRALHPIAQALGATFVQQAVTRFDPQHHTAELADGSELAYDAAVVCVGARQRDAFRKAVTFRVPGKPLEIDELLRQAASNEPRRLALVVPPGVTWSLPLYELALMSKRRGEELRLGDIECVVVTPESAPLIMFGALASDAVAALLTGRGVQIRTGAWAREGEDGSLVLTPGDQHVEAGAVIALPTIEGPGIPGLPADEHGFIPIDDHARVDGLEGVYAAGDGTTFPIKQGGLGTQQADAAAEHIAARFGASIDPQPFRPVLRGKLLAGDESLNLQAGISGGTGEGVASSDYLWWPPHKVSGRYLAPWLAGEEAHGEPEPPRHPIDVEISLPKEWHREPMALDPYDSMTPE